MIPTRGRKILPQSKTNKYIKKKRTANTPRYWQNRTNVWKQVVLNRNYIRNENETEYNSILGTRIIIKSTRVCLQKKIENNNIKNNKHADNRGRSNRNKTQQAAQHKAQPNNRLLTHAQKSTQNFERRPQHTNKNKFTLQKTNAHQHMHMTGPKQTETTWTQTDAISTNSQSKRVDVVRQHMIVQKDMNYHNQRQGTENWTKKSGKRTNTTKKKRTRNTGRAGKSRKKPHTTKTDENKAHRANHHTKRGKMDDQC